MKSGLWSPKIAAVFLLAAFLFFYRLGDRPLRNPDEGRYATIASEMVQSGDWVKPTLFGLGYLRKPPLFYWLVAASFDLFGENEGAARLVPALFGVAGVLMVFFFARFFFDETTGLLAALILASNLWYVQVSRYLVIDAVFSFFLTGAILFFYAAFNAGQKKSPLYWLCFLFLGFAFLAKGLAALAVTGMIILGYLVMTRRFRELWCRPFFTGGLLFLSLALPWFLAMEARQPGFVKFFFWHEHVQRFISADFEHQEAWYYYAVLLPVFFLPWSLAVRPWRRLIDLPSRESGKDFINYLFLSAGTLLIFYSMSRSKLPTYLLPCFPFLSIAAGCAWKRWIQSRPLFGAIDLVPVAILMIFAIAAMLFANGGFSSWGQFLPEAVISHVKSLAALALAAGVFCLNSIKRQRPGRLFLSYVFLTAGLTALTPPVMEALNPAYSSKAFAEQLKPVLKDADEVFIFDHPGPFYDFPFYLKHRVKLVGLEGELEFSRNDAVAGQAAVSREAFFSRIKENKKMFALMRKSDFAEMDASLRTKLKKLKEDDRKILVQSGADE